MPRTWRGHMRRKLWMLAGLVLAMASSASMAGGGGCLAGAYQYYNDDGQLVGAQTVSCNPNSAWGSQTGTAVFRTGCGVSSCRQGDDVNPGAAGVHCPVRQRWPQPAPSSRMGQPNAQTLV